MHKTPMNANRKWHQNVMNLLLGKNMCGACLSLDDDLVEWDDRFVFDQDDLNLESSLKRIMVSTFTSSILDIVSTTKFCQKCIDVILKAFFLIHKIQQNYKYIQKRIIDISQQMKWTQYLDETGSLSEIKDNFEKFDENEHSTAKKAKITHRIILNEEPLTTKFLKDPGMHRFLFRKIEIKETKLPVGITVKKVVKAMKDVASHELVQLDCSKNTDYEAVIPNTQVSKNKLHSNEALILDLMKEAKTKTNHKIPLQNSDIDRTIKINGDNSLAVNLVYGPNIVNESDENMDIVPQDLLELKWPDDDTCNANHCMKIPVKKVNFNEALTVKFIPGQNANRDQEIDSDITPHELLELSWNEDPETIEAENNSLEAEEKHNIDLTKWLRDLGMSTIKTNALENKRQSNEIPQNVDQKKKNIKTHSEELNGTNENHYTEMDKKDPSNSMISNNDCNDEEVTSTLIINKESDIFRCALCCLTFDQFEAYTNHYKTHGITENAKCDKCPVEFSKIELLLEHLILNHSENVAYCTVCFAILCQEKAAHHMATYHETKIPITNTLEEKATIVKLELQPDEYCKKCKQPIDIASCDPRNCIDKNAGCTECKKACVHEKYLSSYRDQLKANKQTFKCTDCMFIYKNRCDIIEHCNEVHLKQNPYRCKICNIGFELKTSLGKHNSLIHVRCRGCRRVFEDRVSMSKHKCNASGATKKCELCGQKFNESKYTQHKECALIVNEECVFCYRVVPVKCNMVRHMEYIHNVCLKECSESIVYQCLLCACKFNNDKEFSTHNWVHTGVHECHVCAKRFSSKTLYETHFKVHSADQCDLAKLFICSVCGEQMKDKYAWTNHMQGHSDHEKCSICSRYVEKASLSSHIQQHEVPETEFKCPHCPLICNSHNQYEVHVNRSHLQNRPYECDTCKKRFYGKLSLRQHMNVHNKFKCKLCPRKFASKRNLDQHTSTHFTA